MKIINCKFTPEISNNFTDMEKYSPCSYTIDKNSNNL